ncbi:MAG: VCBS repeat-containing protein [Planctomycetes bacterium]|nr:VCBS repeat-containing protein [Planctomycetota bacterium]
MSPQFVDFDADGRLDIVAGIFDGSPHLVRGTEKGWGAPEQILDRDGQRIVFNKFWNFDTKKWDETKRCDPDGHTPSQGGLLTSAVAFDVDGDGDLDLVCGDHYTGAVLARINEGTAKAPRFAAKNTVVHAAGKPIDVPGTVATVRLVDWNGDGLQDLVCGGMGDPYGTSTGGGVFLFPNVGTKAKAEFGAMVTLLEASAKGMATATRPDVGLHPDFADVDGDGDLDMVVGGYSLWSPPTPVLTAAQEQRVKELKAELDKASARLQTFYRSLDEQVKGLAEEAADAKRSELLTAKKDDLQAWSKQRQELQKELDPMIPGQKRESFVWLYENRAAAGKPATPR